MVFTEEFLEDFGRMTENWGENFEYNNVHVWSLTLGVGRPAG